MVHNKEKDSGKSQRGSIKLTQRCGDGLSWGCSKGNSSPSSGSEGSLGKAVRIFVVFLGLFVCLSVCF